MANTNQDVRLVVLPQNFFEYLSYVFETHCKQGLDPEELSMAAELWQRVKTAPKIDFNELGKAKLENISPTHVEVALEPESRPVEA